MSVNEAIRRLEDMQMQVIHGSNTFGDIAAMLREAKEIIEIAYVGLRTDITRQDLAKRAQKWLNQ